MVGFSKPTNPEATFVRRILEEVTKRLPSSHVIPVFSSDPEESDPTNLWMRHDGRLRGRYWNGSVYVYVDYPMRTDITSPPAVPAAPAAPAKPAMPITYQKTYPATWSQTYTGTGTKRTDGLGETHLVVGNSGADSYGTQRALVGFDSSAIATDLAGSTIHKVEVQMTNLHAYWESGVEIYFGMHNKTSEPTTWPVSGDLPIRRAVSHHFGRAESLLVPLAVSFGQLLRAGTATGLALEAPTAERDYYGYAAGVGSGYTPPQLVVTYAK